jgi:signal transduction histidine kinase/CheY-like chemotaxis protein
MPTAADGAERVLILAPRGRDARAAAHQLGEAGLDCIICAELGKLTEALHSGAGVALIAEEAFFRETSGDLTAWVAAQPAWSDFPFIVLTTQQTSPDGHAYRLGLLQSLGNVSLLERPLGAVSLISAVKAALRARRRQYQVRDHLLAREQTAARLEELVRDRTRELVDANRQLRQQIAEREEAESALQQAQKMELVGQMTGGVAHDFNNLLTAVLGNLELAIRRAQDDTTRRYLTNATQAAQRGAKLTAQLLAFSRKQRLQTEATDVNALVSGMGDLLFRTIGATVRIETVIEKNAWPAMIDASQVELIVLNLAINARDAMPTGGRLTIATANSAPGDPLRPRDLAPGEYVVISVTDTGTGMTDEVIAKAFEPFFTTKPTGSGTGLGLSQVYGISTQMGGGVRIDSKPGRGTTIAIYLPRAQQAAVSSSGAVGPHIASPPQHATVLVVDDDADVRELAVSCLQTLGYEVLSADSGKAALALLAGAAQIDLLLLDFAMPEMTGLDIARAAAVRRRSLPVLFMTGYVAGSGAEELAGQTVIAKPFTIAELADKVAAALKSPPADEDNVVPLRTSSRG